MATGSFVRNEKKVVWFQRPGDRNYTLVVELSGDELCFLDYYDTEQEAKIAAHHFAKCAKLAYLEGFSIFPGFFIHPAGYGISVAEALVAGESPNVFRRNLQRLKAGTYTFKNLSRKQVKPSSDVHESSSK